MAPVFGHGRLRLYLLGLLDEAPRHGYEVIRLLEERFHGQYAPSAGTVYPRLAKLEQEGLVTHTTEGGRKVYRLTDAGRAELAGRREELADLEREIESVSGLAAGIREDVRGSVRDLREEIRAEAERAHGRAAGLAEEAPAWDQRTDREAWKRAKQEWGRVRREMKERTRRAEEESRRARQEAAAARDQARRDRASTHEELLRIGRRMQEQVQEQMQHLGRGEWPAGLLEGIGELTRELTALADPSSRPEPAHRPAGARQDGPEAPGAPPPGAGAPGRTAGAGAAPEPAAPPPGWAVPEWAQADDAGSADPLRDLERLLDRFRDDVRDAARDRGLTPDQLRDVRRHLSTAAAHVGAVLHGGARGTSR